MERRQFLALLSTPALVALLQACGDSSGTGGAGGGTGETTDGDGFEVIRSSLSRRSTTPADAADAVRALNALAGDLYRTVATGRENAVFSPLSLFVALSMTRVGAAGATAESMDNVLHVADTTGSAVLLNRGVNALTAALDDRSGTFDVGGETATVELNVTNSLWGQRGITWATPFIDTLAVEYGAEMRAVDYRTDTEGARRAINSWVSKATRERIPELLGDGALSSNSRLTLVNAVYMKARWLEPFASESTIDAPFTSLDGQRIEVPMMATSIQAGHTTGDGWQAVELPYVNGELAMTLLVPDAGSFTDVEGRLATVLDDAVAGLVRVQVDLSMPRFEVESRTEMSEALTSLGMGDAFDPARADFSKMTLDEQLFVSYVIHQANITVDEEGTEAAAATAIGMDATSAPGVIVNLDIDRPFVFAVRDVPTGAVLFLGRVTNPSL